MEFNTLKDMDFNGKKVLLRADFNVPIKDGKVADDQRLLRTLPTIQHILEQGVKQLIICTHLGRPKGKVVEEMRVTPVAQRLSELLAEDVKKVDFVLGELPDDLIVMIENVQFEPGERDNDPEYGKKLSEYADIFVLDAFGQCHRNYATLTQIQQHIPSCAGFLLEEEVRSLGKLLENPERPFIAILGGVKLETKIALINNMLDNADNVLVGGAMIFTFYKADGKEIGKSIVDDEFVGEAKQALGNEKLVLPSDVVIADEFDNNSPKSVVSVDSIPADKIGLDIGPDSINEFTRLIAEAKTIVWNGPMGAFEMSNFADGTLQLADAIAESSATTLVGGGDSLAAASQAGVLDRMSHVSTGGGAMLEFLSGKTLPGIAALAKVRQ